MTVDNAAAAFIDQPIAEGLGDATALVTPAGRVTYAELSALVDREVDTAEGLDIAVALDRFEELERRAYDDTEFVLLRGS